jgi:ferredoxin-NADP reductase
MSTHTVKLLRREEVAEGTMSFYFDKPANFQFKPGQYVDCSLIDPPETDAEGNIRTFSIASAPAEKELMVARRDAGYSIQARPEKYSARNPAQDGWALGFFHLA